MASDYALLIIVTIFIWIVILSLLFSLLYKLKSLKSRIALPILVVCLIASIGSIFSFVINADILPVFLDMPVPTLAIFTLLPLIEKWISMRKHWPIVAICSIIYSFIFYLYVWGSNFGGVDMIFLSFSPILPGSNSLSILVIILVDYLELVALAGIAAAFPCIIAYYYRSLE